MGIITKDLTSDMWKSVEMLFGSKGACGGCWCQAWRIEKGERWEDIRGDSARERLRVGIEKGSVHAVLAFDDIQPVGWCTYGPRDSFPRLNRARTLKCDDSHLVWSLPCFFVIRGYRGQGVATAMLGHAVKTMQNRGVGIAEGYPSKPDKQGRYIATFAWTGTQSLFNKAGFVVVGNPDGSKQRVRRILHQ